MKDLGHYASDRDGFFNGLTESYGSKLEGLHVDEKLLLLLSIFTYHLSSDEETMDAIWKPGSESDRAPELFNILKGLEPLDADIHFGFAEALLNQVRESYRLHKSFFRQLFKAGIEEELASQVASILADGGDRTQAECELVSQAWEQVFKVDERLAKRMDAAMGVGE
ncbi:hypothetical protein H6G00_00335 [Leptolyngbya sp. FACHB-541]|uniref:hypothetical protein n=1 Tax=Leptolyngbya sp. FACHB-541 TaxID=2692810 RepID=UPI001684A20D|nr:hypothetical protein [Leptolyngbya sp. FACHB-541]MBD1995076.1 hypothetical protein [Leptolyngbya sp. FACHB-541]